MEQLAKAQEEQPQDYLVQEQEAQFLESSFQTREEQTPRKITASYKITIDSTLVRCWLKQTGSVHEEKEEVSSWYLAPLIDFALTNPGVWNLDRGVTSTEGQKDGQSGQGREVGAVKNSVRIISKKQKEQSPNSLYQGHSQSGEIKSALMPHFPQCKWFLSWVHTGHGIL